MSDQSKSFDVLIRTDAELEGAQQLEESLQRQIVKARLLGEQYTELESQLQHVHEAIDAYKSSAEAAGHADEEAGKKVEFLTLRKQELKKLVRELAQEFPLLGKAIGWAMNPMVATLTIVIGLFALGKRHLDDWNKALDEMGNKARAPIGDMKEALFEAVDAVAASKIALKQWREEMADTMGKQAAMFDQAVTKIHAQYDATREIMQAQKEQALQEIATAEALKKISPEEANLRRAAVERIGEHSSNTISGREAQEEIRVRQQQLGTLVTNRNLLERSEAEAEKRVLNVRERAKDINKGKTEDQVKAELEADRKKVGTPENEKIRKDLEWQKAELAFALKEGAAAETSDWRNMYARKAKDAQQKIDELSPQVAEENIPRLEGQLKKFQEQANAVKEAEAANDALKKKITETNSAIEQLTKTLADLINKAAIDKSKNTTLEAIHDETAKSKGAQDLFNSPIGNLFMLAAQGENISLRNKYSLPKDRIPLTGEQASAMAGATGVLGQAGQLEDVLSKGGKITQEQSQFLRQVVSIFASLDNGQRQALETMVMSHQNTVQMYQKLVLLERDVAAFNKRLNATNGRVQNSYLQ